MVTVFLGYRDEIEHVLLFPVPKAYESQITNKFIPEIEEWCKTNLSGPARPVYVAYERKENDGSIRTYARYEFEFANERDAILFKLFHIG